jgi:hypothetical protein
MLNYVAGAMIGVSFDLNSGTIIAVVATILILVLPAILPNEPEGKHGLH